MKPVIRRIPIKKKRAKPLAEVHKAELHKAAKSAAKTVKLVKAFLIQKCSRKITELREALTVHGCDASALESKLELELAQLQLFKLISSSDMCSRMCSLLSVGDKHDINLKNEMSAVIDTVLRQKRVLQWMQDTEAAIVSAVAKNNDLRAEEQKRDAKQLKKSKGLLAERKVSLKERTTAVFLDSLDSAGGGDETTKKRNKKNDQVRLQKNLRNQQNRSANKQKKQPQPNNPRDPPQDLSVYMPVNRRSGRDQKFAASSSGGRVAGVKRKVLLLGCCLFWRLV